MKISLLHPSRNRPAKAFATYQNWLNKASSEVELEYLLSLDIDEPNAKGYINSFYNSNVICVNKNQSGGYVVGATNEAAKLATGDILVYLSDDFDCPYNWDRLIAQRLDITKPQILKVDDCLQPFNVGVLTIPIMTSVYYDLHGYFFYPEYKSMFCDEDLYNVAKLHNRLILAPDLKFPHLHPANPKAELRGQNDDTYKRSSGMWEQGKAVLKKRKSCNYAS